MQHRIAVSNPIYISCRFTWCPIEHPSFGGTQLDFVTASLSRRRRDSHVIARPLMMPHQEGLRPKTHTHIQCSMTVCMCVEKLYARALRFLIRRDPINVAYICIDWKPQRRAHTKTHLKKQTGRCAAGMFHTIEDVCLQYQLMRNILERRREPAGYNWVRGGVARMIKHELMRVNASPWCAAITQYVNSIDTWLKR